MALSVLTSVARNLPISLPQKSAIARTVVNRDVKIDTLLIALYTCHANAAKDPQENTDDPSIKLMHDDIARTYTPSCLRYELIC